MVCIRCSRNSGISINIGRLLPQSVYYFYAFSQLSKNIDDVISKFKSASLGSGGEQDKYVRDKNLKIVFLQNINEHMQEDLKNILKKYPGTHKVYFEIGVNGSRKLLETDFQVKNTAFLVTELRNKLGPVISVGDC